MVMTFFANADGLKQLQPSMEGTEEPEAEPDGSTFSVDTTLGLMALCTFAAIDGADVGLLPASFRSLEVEFGFSPEQLSLLQAAQGLALALTAPFWGCIADNGIDRTKVLGWGAAMWGTVTLCLACVTGFPAMLFLRFLNGCALSTLAPMVQSLVGDSHDAAGVGFKFGMIEFWRKGIGEAAAVGMTTSISNRMIFGLVGWRVAFGMVAVISWIMATVILCKFKDRHRPWTPQNIRLGAEMNKFLGYFKIPSFVIIVIAGQLSLLVSTSMGFDTMYFQYLGLTDLQAGCISAIKINASGVGTLLGGILGDEMAKMSNNHGRPLTAQASSLLVVPMILALYVAVPSTGADFMLIACLSCAFGLVMRWAVSACNKPIFLQIVSRNSLSSMIGWERCLEGTISEFLGPFLVGQFAMNTFEYHTEQNVQIDDMSEDARAHNADALGRSIAIIACIPKLINVFILGFLHITYARDRGYALEKSKQEGEAVKDDTDPFACQS